MPKTQQAKKGVYKGRLAFDPETEFHVAEDGRKVVTDDGGKTWRYAQDGDTSHVARYHERFAVIDGTQNRLLELVVEHGPGDAERIMREENPHHYEVQPDDPHFGGVRFHPDHEAPTKASHTDAGGD